MKSNSTAKLKTAKQTSKLPCHLLDSKKKENHFNKEKKNWSRRETAAKSTWKSTGTGHVCHVSSFPLAPSFPRHATCFLPYPLFWDSLQILYRFSPWRSKHKLDTSNNKPIEHQRGAIITNCVITAHLHNRCINNCSEWASRGAQSQRRPQSGTAPGPHRDRTRTAPEPQWNRTGTPRFNTALAAGGLEPFQLGCTGQPVREGARRNKDGHPFHFTPPRQVPRWRLDEKQDTNRLANTDSSQPADDSHQSVSFNTNLIPINRLIWPRVHRGRCYDNRRAATIFRYPFRLTPRR